MKHTANTEAIAQCLTSNLESQAHKNKTKNMCLLKKKENRGNEELKGKCAKIEGQLGTEAEENNKMVRKCETIYGNLWDL